MYPLRPPIFPDAKIAGKNEIHVSMENPSEIHVHVAMETHSPNPIRYPWRKPLKISHGDARLVTRTPGRHIFQQCMLDMVLEANLEWQKESGKRKWSNCMAEALE